MELRDYQKRVCERAVKLFEKGDNKNPHPLNSLLVESPVGSGKTIMALWIAKYFEEKYGWRTSWCAMRRKLLTQALEMNDASFKVKNFTAVSMFDNNPPEADFLIIDEGHHAAAASAFTIDSKTKPKKYLGLSATPLRADKIELPFQKTVRDAGIHKLIREGWLSPFHHWTIEEYTPQSVANTYLNGDWGKSIVFFHTMDQCREFERLVTAGGKKCGVVSSAESMDTREETIEQFENGDIDVVANVYILSEGFDFPALQTVFVRDSSKVVTIQMSGRGLRLYDGKEICNIVQSKNSPWPFTRTAHPKNASVMTNGNWESISGWNEAIDQIAKDTMNELIHSASEVNLPKMLVGLDRVRERRARRRQRF